MYAVSTLYCFDKLAIKVTITELTITSILNGDVSLLFKN